MRKKRRKKKRKNEELRKKKDRQGNRSLEPLPGYKHLTNFFMGYIFFFFLLFSPSSKTKKHDFQDLNFPHPLIDIKKKVFRNRTQRGKR